MLMTLSDRITEARQLVQLSKDAAEGDSNDDEIQALQDARDALTDLVDRYQAATSAASNIAVGVWVSDLDGVPVVQIDVPDNTGHFRINVNDGAIWDQATDTPFTPPTS